MFFKEGAIETQWKEINDGINRADFGFTGHNYAYRFAKTLFGFKEDLPAGTAGRDWFVSYAGNGFSNNGNTCNGDIRINRICIKYG
jgi:hypothetical protein